MSRKRFVCCIVLFACLLLTFAGSFAYAKEDKINNVYLGGDIVGFKIGIDGVEVIDVKDIQTEEGLKNSSEHICVGDVIKQIDNVKTDSVADIALYLDKIDSGVSVNLQIERNGENIDVQLIPLVDKYTKVKKLGIFARENVAGLGTVTFITQDGKFGALGHGVTDGKKNVISKNQKGKLYNCFIDGVVKGKKGKAGYINGYLSSEVIGGVEKNSKEGIYGDMSISGSGLLEVGYRDTVKPGKAKLCSAISGTKEYYDIEIVKAVYQSSEADKGMIIKITDKRLIDLTGGIVQGMSGSPIIQNGKLIGALTHVFVNDPKRGYGIYIDWMLDE